MISRELLQQPGRRGGDLFIAALADDLPGNKAVVRMGVAGHLPIKGRLQLRHADRRLLQQELDLLRVIDVDSPLADVAVCLVCYIQLRVHTRIPSWNSSPIVCTMTRKDQKAQ